MKNEWVRNPRPRSMEHVWLESPLNVSVVFICYFEHRTRDWDATATGIRQDIKLVNQYNRLQGLRWSGHRRWPRIIHSLIFVRFTTAIDRLVILTGLLASISTNNIVDCNEWRCSVVPASKLTIFRSSDRSSDPYAIEFTITESGSDEKRRVTANETSEVVFSCQLFPPRTTYHQYYAVRLLVVTWYRTSTLHQTGNCTIFVQSINSFHNPGRSRMSSVNH